MSLCICAVQYANLWRFEIALHKLEIVELQANFKSIQPLLRTFEIAHEPTVGRTTKGRLSGELKTTPFLPELQV